MFKGRTKMTKEILVEAHVDTITMPENLRIGLMISNHRKKCQSIDPITFMDRIFASGQIT
jgi:hypothetical protein